MVFKRSVMKTVTAMLVSATMALPMPLWAEQSPSNNDPSGEATEGIPVIVRPFDLPDGKTGYYVVAPYLEKDEREVVANFATRDPNNFILGISGPNDPALKFALETGNLNLINSFIVADADQLPAIQAAPKPLRERLKDKIKAITEFGKKKKIGLITAVVVSGMIGKFVAVKSASVPVGVGAFFALFAWGAYQAAATDRWERYLHNGGKFFAKLMARAMGRAPTRDEKEAFESIGMFNATWAVNTTIEAGILGASGMFNDILATEKIPAAALDIFLTSFWYGFLASTDILDAVVAKKVKQGRLPANALGTFVVFRMIAAAAFQIAAYMHVDNVQWVLAGATSFSLIYLAFRRINRSLDYSYDKAKEKAENARRFILEKRTGRLIPCEVRLGQKNITFASSGDTKGEPAE